MGSSAWLQMAVIVAKAAEKVNLSREGKSSILLNMDSG
jgi:hypothetical protein